MVSTDLVYKNYSSLELMTQVNRQLSQRFKKQLIGRRFISKTYQIGDLNLHIFYSNNALVEFFHPAISFSTIDKPNPQPTITIYIIEDQEYNAPNYFKSFSKFYEDNNDEVGIIVGMSHLLNLNEKLACIKYLEQKSSTFYYLMGNLNKIPKWERWFPFRNLLNHICQPTSNQLLHAASVVHDNKGILLAGKSGSGKSTTTFSCILNGLQSVGDDLILVNVDQKEMYCASNMFKLCRDIFTQYSGRFPAILQSSAFYDYNQKYHIDMHRFWPAAITDEANIKAIVIPIVTDDHQPSIAQISSNQALSALVPSTLLLLQGKHSKSTIRKIRKLVEGLPCYQLQLSKDLKANALFIRRFLENLI